MVTTLLTFNNISFAYFRISQKWNIYYVFFCMGLSGGIDIVFVRFTHVAVHSSSAFFLVTQYIV